MSGARGRLSVRHGGGQGEREPPRAVSVPIGRAPTPDELLRMRRDFLIDQRELCRVRTEFYRARLAHIQYLKALLPGANSDTAIPMRHPDPDPAQDEQGVVVAGRIGERGFPLPPLIEEYKTVRGVGDLSDSHHERSIVEIRRAARLQDWNYAGDITAMSVAKHLERYKLARRGGATRNLIRSYLLNFCEWLVQTARARLNPVKAVPCARVQKREARLIPTEAQVHALVAAAKSDWRKKDRWLIYTVAYETGVRRGSLIGKAKGRGGQPPWPGLSKHHFYLDDAYPHLRVPGAAQKNGLPVRAELPHWLADELREHFKEVPGERAFIIKRIKEDHFDRDLAKAGLPKRDPDTGATFTFGSLRHAFNERLRRAGVPLELRAKAMGHTSTKMTEEVYSHPTSMEFRAVIDRHARHPEKGAPEAPIKKMGWIRQSDLTRNGVVADTASATLMDRSPMTTLLHPGQRKPLLVGGSAVSQTSVIAPGSGGFFRPGSEANATNGGCGSNPPTPIVRGNAPRFLTGVAGQQNDKQNLPHLRSDEAGVGVPAEERPLALQALPERAGQQVAGGEPGTVQSASQEQPQQGPGEETDPAARQVCGEGGDYPQDSVRRLRQDSGSGTPPGSHKTTRGSMALHGASRDRLPAGANGGAAGCDLSANLGVDGRSLLLACASGALAASAEVGAASQAGGASRLTADEKADLLRKIMALLVLGLACLLGLGRPDPAPPEPSPVAGTSAPFGGAP